MPINTGVIICEEYEEAIKAIFKSVDTKESVYGIKSVVLTLKGKKTRRFYLRVSPFYFFYKKYK